MKKLILGIVLFASFYTIAQSPRKVVQDQLEAYNARDISAFIQLFSEDIELWTLGDTLPSVIGIESVKKVYADLFDRSPNLHSEVINRTVIGDKVIDYEKITGRAGKDKNQVLYLVMIYEVREGEIYRATAVRE